jgi:hypothetical protein
MNRPLISAVIALLCLISPFRAGMLGAQPVASKDIQDFLNAPVWYVAYEVSYKGSHEETYNTPALHRSGTFTISLDRSFSGSTILNVRSPGPGALSLSATTGRSSDGSALTPAQQAEMAARMQAMYMRMDELANWMAGGSNLGEPTQDDVNADIEASKGPALVKYERVDKGDAIDTAGRPFKFTNRTTGRAEGRVSSASSMLTLDIDAASKQYTLYLPFAYNPMGSPPGSQETVHVTETEGQPPHEERSTEDFDLEFPRDLALDDSEGHMEKGVVLKGDIDPATSRISGEQSFKAHFSDSHGATVSGTLTFRYTLTMTPPEEQSAKGK